MLRTSIFPLFIAIIAPVFSACAAEQDLGSRGGSSAALSLGEPCSCDYTEGCCVAGLICDECHASSANTLSCASSNGIPDRKCREPRPAGVLCSRGDQCASGTCGDGPPDDRRSICAPGSDGSSTSLPPGRCRESLDCPDGNVCVESHCKLARGERCTSSAECASNKCYGNGPWNYACL